MKSLLSAMFIALLSGTALTAAEVWPDGTQMEEWFTSAPAGISGREARRFVITDYGVVKDSTLLQTAAIQKVIDLAAEDGGTVVIPDGVYLTSSLFFKPGTHLHLEKGAVLKGSDDVSDYEVREVHIEGVIQPYIAALVNAYGVDGFSITGEGVIDGNGLRYWRDFWTRRRVNPACTNLEALRPRMIYVAQSEDIFIEGVTLRNSGFWTTHLYKCDYVRIKDVTIFAPNEPVPAPSSDAIDLDACNNVHISGCRISVNDDIVCLKGGKGPWADQDPDNGTNSNILVEDCWFGRGPGVLTFGSECIGGREHHRRVQIFLLCGSLDPVLRPQGSRRLSHVLRLACDHARLPHDLREGDSRDRAARPVPAFRHSDRGQRDHRDRRAGCRSAEGGLAASHRHSRFEIRHKNQDRYGHQT